MLGWCRFLLLSVQVCCENLQFEIFQCFAVVCYSCTSTCKSQKLGDVQVPCCSCFLASAKSVGVRYFVFEQFRALDLYWMADKRGHVTTRLARGKSLDLGPDRTNNIRDCCICVVWWGTQLFLGQIHRNIGTSLELRSIFIAWMKINAIFQCEELLFSITP